jgi:hypothetical protein
LLYIFNFCRVQKHSPSLFPCFSYFYVFLSFIPKKAVTCVTQNGLSTKPQSQVEPRWPSYNLPIPGQSLADPSCSLPRGPQPATSPRSHLLLAAVSAPRAPTAFLLLGFLSVSSSSNRSFAWSHRGLGSGRARRMTVPPRRHQSEKW